MTSGAKNRQRNCGGRAATRVQDRPPNNKVLRRYRTLAKQIGQRELPKTDLLNPGISEIHIGMHSGGGRNRKPAAGPAKHRHSRGNISCETRIETTHVNERGHAKRQTAQTRTLQLGSPKDQEASHGQIRALQQGRWFTDGTDIT